MTLALGICCIAASAALVWLCIRAWYGRLVRISRQEVCHTGRRIIPGDPPRTLFGNLPGVAGFNRLAAYNGLSCKFWRNRPVVLDVASSGPLPATGWRCASGFHGLFLAHEECLASKYLPQSEGTPFDILPDLTAASLDIIAATTLGRNLGASGPLHGRLNS
jgi:hypothetical protein